MALAAGALVLEMGGEVLFMTWLWMILGIFGFFIALFFISCAILSHYLDGHDDDDKGDWY